MPLINTILLFKVHLIENVLTCKPIMVDNAKTLLSLHRNFDLVSRLNNTSSTTTQILKDIDIRITQNQTVIDSLYLSRPQLLRLKEIISQCHNPIALQTLIQKELHLINKLIQLRRKSSRTLLTIKAITQTHYASIRTAQRLIKTEVTISFLAQSYALQSIKHTANINWIIKESPDLTNIPLITGHIYG